MLTSVGWLIVARLSLIRRAFARPIHPIARLFRGIDKCLEVTFGQQSTERRLPDQHPISWRETQTGIFGSARYEVYAVVLVEIIVLLWIGYLKATSDWDVDPAAIVNGMLLMFLCAALMVGAKSVALFSAERSQQTLDVLLSTPLSNREILRQKFLGVRNLIALVLIPGLTFTVFFALEASQGAELHMKHFGFDIFTYYLRDEFNLVRFYIVHLVTLVVYPGQSHVDFVSSA